MVVDIARSRAPRSVKRRAHFRSRNSATNTRAPSWQIRIAGNTRRKYFVFPFGTRRNQIRRRTRKWLHDSIRQCFGIFVSSILVWMSVQERAGLANAAVYIVFKRDKSVRVKFALFFPPYNFDPPHRWSVLVSIGRIFLLSVCIVVLSPTRARIPTDSPARCSFAADLPVRAHNWRREIIIYTRSFRTDGSDIGNVLVWFMRTGPFRII